MTHQRATVLAALAAAGTHPSAESVAEHAAELDPGIHLATVYRTLHVLEEHRVVSHVHLGHGPAVYHLAHERHAHAVCRVCGHALEVPDHLLEALADELRQRLGFTLDPGHFALSGWCQACPSHPDAHGDGDGDGQGEPEPARADVGRARSAGSAHSTGGRRRSGRPTPT